MLILIPVLLLGSLLHLESVRHALLEAAYVYPGDFYRLGNSL